MCVFIPALCFYTAYYEAQEKKQKPVTQGSGMQEVRWHDVVTDEYGDITKGGLPPKGKPVLLIVKGYYITYVGYMTKHFRLDIWKEVPYFVIPGGVGGSPKERWEVAAWCDCLPEIPRETFQRYDNPR
jgi:hypothetical protein